MQKIFIFQDQPEPVTRHGDISGIAVCEDGNVLAGHVSSGPGWLKHDLTHFYREKYNEHCGEGNWELEWVDDYRTHAGCMRASELNKGLCADHAEPTVVEN